MALGIALLSALALAIVTPIAGQQWAAVPAFIPAYQAAVAVNDLVTAALLLAGFREARRPSLLLLGCAYAYTAILVVAHTLSFPDLFGAGNLVGGPQTTVWLWLAWHIPLPVFVILHALAVGGTGTPVPQSEVAGGRGAVLGVIIVASGIAALATLGHGWLPALLEGNGYIPGVTRPVLAVPLVLSLLALAVLVVRTRLRRALDLWLAVAMGAWAVEILLSAVLNSGRFQAGFYVGRLYGLLASCTVLVSLLLATAALHGRLARALAGERDAARTALGESEARYRLTVESARGFAIVTLDAGGVITGWNAGAEAMMGHQEAEALGQPGAIFFSPEDRAAGVPEAEMRNARETGRAEDERWHLRRDGSRFWGSGLVMPLVGGGGYVKIFRDMTREQEMRGERERLVAALDSERARLRAVFQAVPVGLVLAEAPSGRITEGNAQVEAILRHPVLPSADIQAYREWVSFHPDGRQVEGHEYPLARVIHGEAERPEIEVLYRRGDGTEGWVRFVAAPVRDEGGVVRGGVVAALDIDRERRAIEELQAARDRQALLIAELNHRVKNTLATIQSLAHQTLRTAETPHAFERAFTDRLLALARAHDLLSRTEWEGATVEDVARTALAPWLAQGRIGLQGPAVRLIPRHALALSMAFGELATNAVKYGALSTPVGGVAVAWLVASDGLALDWEEVGGPPVTPPTRRGLGSRLLGRPLAAELGGSVELLHDVAGVRCLFRFPFGASMPKGAARGVPGSYAAAGGERRER